MIPGIKATIVGVKNLKKKVDEVAKAAEKSQWDALVATGLMIHKDAVMSVQRGPKTGSISQRGSKGTHQASAPGEAPASDTGNLAKNIRFKPDKASKSVSIIAKTPYAGHLEFGTRGDPKRNIPPLAPRPFMGPAFNKNRAMAEKLLRLKWKENKPKE